jgi:hypothetical protein
MKNNKGLSTIVATLIIILLVLVATGIIWVVIRGVINDAKSGVASEAMCLESQVVATKVTRTAFGVDPNGLNVYSVTLSREGGNDELGGVNLVFTDNLGENNFVQEIPGNVPRLGMSTHSVSIPVNATGLTENATKVTVVVYFTNEDGTAYLCQAQNSLQF